jgi:hypothetical protein
MKTLLAFLGLAVGLVGIPAFANSANLVCEQDDRPADGSYTKLKVKFLNGDRANVYLSRISGGFAPPGVGGDNFENQVIGENLACKYGQSQDVSLRCYEKGSTQPVISIGPTNFSGAEFIEVLQNGQSIALFSPSACKSKF